MLHWVLAAVVAALVVGYLGARRGAAPDAPGRADRVEVSLDRLTAYDLAPLPEAGPPARPPGGWQVAAVDGLAAAEGLLDALEVAGFRQRRLRLVTESEFQVRWR